MNSVSDALDCQTVTRLRDVFADYDRQEGPGVAVGVSQQGRTLFSGGWGIANLDYGIPIDADSVFYLASVSKQVTAGAVLFALKEGYLSLQDDIRRFLPLLPDYGTVFTIEHLLHHTSGIRDYLTLLWLAGRRIEDVLTAEQVFELLCAQRAVNFPPGSAHLYSNSNYVLLAEIVRRATGLSLRDYAHARLFQPLGMDSTQFHDDAERPIARRLIGYSPDPAGGFRINHLFNFDQVGDGGLYSSVNDLLKWLENLDCGRVGGPEWLTALHRPGALNDGESISYAGGLAHGQYRGLSTVEHGGGLAGFRTATIRFPEQHVAIVVLGNMATVNSYLLARQVADILLEDSLGPPSETIAPAPAADDASRREIDAGRRPGYAATYWSAELDARYRIQMINDALVLRWGSNETVLRASGPEQLTCDMGLTLVFERDGSDAITAFRLDVGRARGLRFVRE